MVPKDTWDVLPEDMPDLQSALKPIVASASSRLKYWNYWQHFCNEMKISKSSAEPTGSDVVEYFKRRMENGLNANALSQNWCALRKAMEVMYRNSLDDVKGQVSDIISNSRYMERADGGAAFTTKKSYKKRQPKY